MLGRNTLALSGLLGALAALAASAAGLGCKGAQKMHAVLEAAQWSPDFEGSAQMSGGSNFNLVSQGGIRDPESFWNFDLSTRLKAPKGGQVQPYALNLSYWHQAFEGENGSGGASFEPGVTLLSPASSNADVKFYKFSYEELRQTEGATGWTGGIIGIHYLDFAVESWDASANAASFSESAPILVLGWRITYLSGGLLYYFGIEWMDTDIVSLENVDGTVTELYGGMRWFISGQSAALTFGYRTYEADLDVRGDKLDLKLDGTTFGLYFNW